ncbi:DUF1906 domain-containing protein, partial [Micromonospora sp. NPDC049559]|uniref:DUF1906 domain-containing protein n=1 Tax=Micromonospora sp. NPDC049559 TaxID=3155923 RepID=UPI00344405A5
MENEPIGRPGRPSRRTVLLGAGAAILGATGALAAPGIAMAANRRGLDYSWSRPSISAIKAGGYSFVCRYLSHTPDKNLTPSEAKSLINAGIDIVSNWEAGASAALQGYAKGVADAEDAKAQAEDCGMPAGRPIYFSVDFDATAEQQTAINSYFDGIASVIGRGRTGAYGGYYVIKRLFDAGKITFGWQTYAWSGGQWDSRAQLRQIQNGITVGGADCDLDEAVATDFGQWSTGAVPLSRYIYTLESAVVYETFGAATGWVKNSLNVPTAADVLSATWSPAGFRYIYTIEGGRLFETYGSSTGWVKNQVNVPTAASAVSATWSPSGQRYIYTVENGLLFETYGSSTGWVKNQVNVPTAASAVSATWSPS